MLARAAPNARGGRERAQVFGAVEVAALSLSSMHLLTRSARLSRFSRTPAFSVFIQHSRAARARVIGSDSSSGSAGRATCVFGGSARSAPTSVFCAGAIAAIGPRPSVWHAATTSVQMAPSASCRNRCDARVAENGKFVVCIVGMIYVWASQEPGRVICPNWTALRNGLRNTVSQIRARR